MSSPSIVGVVIPFTVSLEKSTIFPSQLDGLDNDIVSYFTSQSIMMCLGSPVTQTMIDGLPSRGIMAKVEIISWALFAPVSSNKSKNLGGDRAEGYYLHAAITNLKVCSMCDWGYMVGRAPKAGSMAVCPPPGGGGGGSCFGALFFTLFAYPLGTACV